MSKTHLIVPFLIFLVFGSTNGLRNRTEYEDDIFLSGHYYVKFICMSCIIFLVLITRHITYEIPIPYPMFLVTFGLLLGIGSYTDIMRELGSEAGNFSYTVRKIKVASLTPTLEDHLSDIYLPIVTYTIGFCTDFHSFLKSLPQIAIITIPGTIASASVTGMMMWKVLGNDTSPIEALLFGAVLSPVSPIEVLHYMKESSVQTKYVKALLHGETFSIVVAIMTFDIINMSRGGNVGKWYHYMSHCLRPLGGIPIGYFFGFIGTYLMKFSYNDVSNLMILTISISFMTFLYGRYLIEAGTVATAVTSLMMGAERSTVLSRKVEDAIVMLWKSLSCIVNGYMFFIIGMLLPEHVKDFNEVVMVIVTYLSSNLSRFIVFFLFSPILSRLGYGMTFQTMIICVWSGLKNPLCVILALELFKIRELPSDRARLYFIHTVVLLILWLLINGSLVRVLLQVLGLREISPSRQTTMNNCMTVIYEARARTIAILKMDRFLTDANWPLVMNSTAIKHPYKKTLPQENEDGQNQDEDYLLNYKYTYCPDCQKHIPIDPTSKEMKEMTKEAKMRILKFKKTAYSRQFENGMISKNGISILHQATEVAMESEELIIHLDGLFKLFEKKVFFHKLLWNQFHHFLQSKETSYKVPKVKWMFECHQAVHHWGYFIVMFHIITLNVIFGFLYIFSDKIKEGYDFYDYLFAANVIFSLIYFAEFVLKVFALTWVNIFRDGLRTYFSRFWTSLEFITLLASIAETLKQGIMNYFHKDKDELIWSIQCLLIPLLLIRLLKISIQLGVFKYFQKVPNQMLKSIDKQVNKHKLLAFELAKNYIAGDEEILENLPQIVDNTTIRKTMKTMILNDRLAVSKKLGLVQKERPWVASTVKSVSSMRAVLNGMKEEIYELKVSGFIDDVEYKKLLNVLSERYKFINSIRFIEPSAPKSIFYELPFVGENVFLADYLYNNLTTKKFDPGSTVVREGEPSDGIYILITGMLLTHYIPSEKVAYDLQVNGIIPVVDYICSMSYNEPCYEYWIPGNTIGELSVLTKRPYDGSITAETHSEVYFLKASVIQRAMDIDSDPINGFECRLWKTVAIRKAVEILIDAPSYRSFTQEKIKYLLERSFMPNLSNYKVFIVNEMMQDIILIEGVVEDFNTREIFIAPCYIPRACQKLIFAKSSETQITSQVETKLLIIPAKDYDEYEIMLSEEQVGEMVNTTSSKCLLHIIQDKFSESSSKSSAKSLKMNVKRRMSKGFKKSGELHKRESTKSRITFHDSSGDESSSSGKASRKLFRSASGNVEARGSNELPSTLITGGRTKKLSKFSATDV